MKGKSVTNNDAVVTGENIKDEYDSILKGAPPVPLWKTWVYKVALNTACTFVRAAVKQKEIKQSPLHQSMQELQPTQESCQADILNRFKGVLSDLLSTSLRANAAKIY